jgi:outer membrane protein assembly factor BamB
LTAFNLTTGKVAWSLPFAGSHILGQPQVYQEDLYVITAIGDLFNVSYETGEIRRRASLEAQFTLQGSVGAGRLFLVDQQRTALAFDLSSWKKAWSYESDEPFAGPPTVESDLVILSTVSGKLLCLSTEGKLKWTQNIGQPIPAGGVIFRNTFLAGTAHGELLSVDIWTGRPMWSFSAQSNSKDKQQAFLARGIVSQGKFFIGSEDHFLYCLTLD